MPRFNEVINNFINGEVSPKMYGRMDSEVYKRSCRTVKNMLVYPQGGAARRVGTEYITDRVPIDNANIVIAEGARVVPFTYENGERYLIVFNKYQDGFNDNYIHYYYLDKGAWKWDNFSDIKAVTSVPGTARHPTAIGSAVESDYLIDSDVLAEMQYVQVGANLIFAHGSFPPFVIVRTSRGVLSMVPYSLQYASATATNMGPFPYMDINLSDVTITSSATAVGATTLTSSAAYFTTAMLGSTIAFQISGVIGWCYIGGYTSSTVVSATIYRTLPGGVTAGTVNWHEGAWSDNRGWPRTVGFFEGCLYFGGTTTFPNRLWKSQTYDIFEMTNLAVLNSGTTVVASDPFYADLSSPRETAEITWIMSSGRDLLVGARKQEFSVGAFNISEIDVKSQTGYGSEYRQPVYVDDVPIYVQRGFRKLREIIFDDRSQGYVSPEVTFLAEHMPRKSRTEVTGTIVEPKIKRLAYQALDNNIVWAIDNNGFLFACTKSRENTVTAFHWHDVGGRVLDICALSSLNGEHDDLYMLVKRTINAADVVFLEKLGRDFYEASLDPDVSEHARLPIFSDCATVYRRVTAATFWAPLAANTTAIVTAGASGTGTTTGTVTYNLREARFNGTSYVTYNPLGSADAADSTGCIRFRATLESSGTLFSMSENAGSNKSLIRIRNLAGAIKITMLNFASANIINDVTFGTKGTDFESYNGYYNIEFNWDITTGSNRLFINGVQVGSTNTATGSRTLVLVGTLKIGANYDGSDIINNAVGVTYDRISDVQVFSTVQHTTTHEVFPYQPLGLTLYGFNYLEGEEVQVTANGNYLGDYTVASGSITLGADYSTMETIVVGKEYQHMLEIQPIDLGSGIGSPMGSIKRVDRAVVRFNASAAARVGPDEDTLDELTFRDSATAATAPIVLVTDDKEIEFSGDYSRTARLMVEHTSPLPCNVTCISIRGITGDV